jgi:uroporphyrinogen decarboxylase
VLGLDWTVNLTKARALVGGPGKALQGNLDPNVLFARPQIEAEVAKGAHSFGTPTPAAATGPTHIFNLGTASASTHRPEHVAALVQRCTALAPDARC